MSTAEHKGRIWTPVSIAVLTVCLSAGFVFIGWCGDSAVQTFKAHLSTIENKQDMIFRSLGLLKEKENADILCLTKGLYQCCGEKADARC